VARPAIHPGETLAGELEELGMTAAELARVLHVPSSRITQIINGQRSITANSALRLGRWFGTGPEFWMNLQKIYDIRLAEQNEGLEIERTIEPRQSTLKLDLRTN
jgi:antitoxin HigA-1